MKRKSMAIRSLFAALCIFLATGLQAQRRGGDTDTAFAGEWNVIDSLIVQRDLTRTALEKVNLLYTRARRMKMPAQELKALMYRYALSARITTDDPTLTIRTLQSELAQVSDPVQQSMLHILLAKQYRAYFDRNRWSLYGRTQTKGFTPSDLQTWSQQDFVSAITRHYLNGLSNKTTLQQQPVTRYDAIVIKGNARYLRPSLYDLLAQDAIEYFRSDIYTTTAVTPSLMSNPALFQPAGIFVQASFAAQDSAAVWHTAQLYQELIRFHQKDTGRNALLDVDLQRLEWAYEKSLLPEKEALYEAGLQDVLQKYAGLPRTAYAWYQLASLQISRAGRYQPKLDTAYRYHYTLALQTIEQARKIFPPDNPAVAELTNLLNAIYQKELSTQTELVTLPGEPILSAVHYRNIDTLYGKIIRLNPNAPLFGQGQEEDWQTAARMNAVRLFAQPLPPNTDHQEHIALYKIAALEPGYYALLTGSSAGFNAATDKLSLQFFHVSSLSFVQDGSNLFVMHRKTGAPLQGVKVTAVKTRWDAIKKRNARDVIANWTTDSNGHLRFDRTDGNWSFIVSIPGDTLDMNAGTYVPVETTANADKFEKNSRRVFYFTDRSIYRPGQEVFFKGIAVTKDPSTKQSRILTGDEKEWVYLRDANNKLIDSLSFILNEYGSFTGRFRLPEGTLTGNFHIETKNFNRSSAYFSVEEYKRPAFEVTLDKTKGSYRLNDSVVVTGKVTAYAGNNVSGARVVYNVLRNKRYMDPYYYFRPIRPLASRQIANGETTTDAQGKFTIRFKATADDITDSTGSPVFDFSVSTNVTDLNGETRSASATVPVGFASMKLNLETKAVNNKDSAITFAVKVSNLGDVPQAADVTTNIYSLQAPGRMIRASLLPKPDVFVMSREAFLRDFPSDEYDNEASRENWKKVKLVWSAVQRIEGRDTVHAGMLPAGHYIIEAFTADSNNVPVKQKIYFQVFDRNDSRIPLPGNNFMYTETSTAEPGATGRFLSGVPANNTFIISKKQTGDNPKGVYDYQYHPAGIRTVTIPVAEKDRGGVSVSEVYVYDNRVYTNTYYVNVPWSNKQLTVSYGTHRDKTEPGSQETWTVTVKGSKGEPVAAELLTAMYDASLDQFKPHSWNVPQLWTSLSANAFNAHNNFTAAYTHMQNYPAGVYMPVEPTTYDRLAASAEELLFEKWQRLSNDASLPAAIRLNYADRLRNLQQSNFNMRSEMLFERAPAAAPPVAALRGAAAGVASDKITVRGKSSIPGDNALYVVDGKLMEGPLTIPADKILSAEVLGGEEAAAKYGSRAAGGVVVVTTAGAAAPVQVRKNMSETAFFFPQLSADADGNFRFSFTMPEALTRWKWMSFAHTKDLAMGQYSTTVVTQKELMVQPNTPRFLREGDNIELTSKVANTGTKERRGQATLELFDAATHTPVDGWFQNMFPMQYFTVAAGQSALIKFPVQVPFGFNKPVTWRIVARSEEVSDGEENTLPVLTNRMAVTESLPLLIRKDTTQTFVFDKLLNNKSESLTHEGITVEYTSNPVWYAVQALPYLVEYPYECAEQTFNRYYATTLASFIINRHPKLKEVLAQWQKDSAAVLSNLQKNQELKQVLLQETPWVLQAENESRQKKNLAILFDLARLTAQSDKFLTDLQQQQLPDGSFSWFKGGNGDRFITNYILTGIGKLKRLGALSQDIPFRLQQMTDKALEYLDSKMASDYDMLIKNKADLAAKQVSGSAIDYLYMRSFYGDRPQRENKAAEFYFTQAKKFWTSFNTYYRAQIGLIAYRQKQPAIAENSILPSLVENMSTDSAKGMFWKNTQTNAWYQQPVEHQAMMIAFMSEINLGKKDKKITRYIDDMKTWLLLNKQTTNWRTTTATADACYALLLNGSDWASANKTVTVRLGNTTTVSNNGSAEAGTGYIKKRIDGSLVSNRMGDITVTVQTQGAGEKSSPSWGSVYWQYFEDMDKITMASSPLSVSKKLFIQKNTDKGTVLQAIPDNSELKIGDKVTVRMEIRTDRDMDYVHLKDMRAAAMEPVNVLSGYKWQGGMGYYESTRDASTNFFFSRLNKGTYVFEYPVFITHAGVFSAGIATIQCMYAPEMMGHTEGVKIRVQ